MTTTRPLPANRSASTFHTLVPLLIAAIGVGLTGYMVFAEGEPGAIPLLLIAVGLGWFVAARFRARRR